MEFGNPNEYLRNASAIYAAGGNLFRSALDEEPRYHNVRYSRNLPFHGWSRKSIFHRPLDALFYREHPYTYRNAGQDDLWFLTVMSPTEFGPSDAFRYGKDNPEEPPSQDEMRKRGMADVWREIKFSDIVPCGMGPKGDRAGTFTFTYKYVGLDGTVAPSKLFDLSLTVIPVGNQAASYMRIRNAETFSIVIDGDVLFWNKNNERAVLHSFDGVHLRDETYTFRNVGQKSALIATTYAPADAAVEYE